MICGTFECANISVSLDFSWCGLMEDVGVCACTLCTCSFLESRWWFGGGRVLMRLTMLLHNDAVGGFLERLGGGRNGLSWDHSLT